MNIDFLATVAVIAPDPTASRRLDVDALGLPLEGDEYQQSEQIAGCKSFGIWPLHQAGRGVLRVAAVARGAACAAGQHRRPQASSVSPPSGRAAPPDTDRS